jgi:3D (Asp-Asp-Asp) domain-containing protein
MKSKLNSFAKNKLFKFIGRKGMLVALTAVLLPAQLVVADPSASTFSSDALKEDASLSIQSLFERPIEETFTATITAYSSEPGQTDDTPFISADGNYVYDGLMACPRRYPFGTKVMVNYTNDTQKIFTCGDRMNLRFDQGKGAERFDIWMANTSDAKSWGLRKLEITVIHA